MERIMLLARSTIACALTAVLHVAAAHAQSNTTPNFSDDVMFLKTHGAVVVLSDSAGQSKIAISPNLQARVMTSTAGGDDGASFGWINRQYFTDAAAGKGNPHISPWGGEDRLWLGPEGGQFSIFFAKAASFDLEHWFTPKWIDVEPFETVSSTSTQATFQRKVSFANYSGTPFDVRIDRTIRLLSADEVWNALHIPATPGVSVVAFESDNRLTNTGSANWTKQSGLLSIWILGMFNATPMTTVVMPIRPGEGAAVNDDYFGKVPPDRLRVIDNVVYFKADAKDRSKIGIPPRRAKPIFGSYDGQHKVLTICQYTFHEAAQDYVNSAWKIQDNPFGGDVANSYNDGPPGDGKPQLGQFYEIETSSPAREMKRGETLSHTHRTMHFQGNERSLDSIAKATLGVSMAQIEAAMK